MTYLYLSSTLLYMQSTPNEFERKNRERKANTLADLLIAGLGPDTNSNLSLDQLADFLADADEADWERAAGLIEAKFVSPETRQVIVSTIRRRARIAAANADPFAGLEGMAFQ